MSSLAYCCRMFSSFIPEMPATGRTSFQNVIAQKAPGDTGRLQLSPRDRPRCQSRCGHPRFRGGCPSLPTIQPARRRRDDHSLKPFPAFPNALKPFEQAYRRKSSKLG